MKKILALAILPLTLLGLARAEADLSPAIATSIKDVRLLSPKWVCVVVDPTEEILRVRNAKFLPELEADKAKYIEDKAAGKHNWFYAFSKRYRTILAQKEYHEPLFAKLNDPSFWSVNGKPPLDATVWAHSVDAFPAWDSSEIPTGEQDLRARAADMTYLELPAPLKSGETLDVKSADGRSGSLTFNDESTPCWSIKVNQSAYASDASRKLAYLGMWLPGIGALDLSAFEGQPFHVKKFEPGDRWDKGTASGAPLYTGSIALRKKFADQHADREGGSNLTGEDVYELDFSAFQGGDGFYCIQIPGLGRSWPFKVTKDGYGDAFFTMMKGLYHQRCGTALTKPHTHWERPACHVETRQGKYVSEAERWYPPNYRKGKPNENEVGFRDESGKRLNVTQFTLISNEDPNAPVMPGVSGGWHDAADYDRRIFHYAGTWDLMALAEAFPTSFSDGQLNIPESGNGIPDLLDEAVWSLGVWKATQTPEGGVSSWIEQKAHPEGVEHGDLEKTFAKDPNPMFAAVPDRPSSLVYAAAAANLARLLAPHSPELSKEFLDSAKRAYSWGKSPDNTLRDLKFPIQDGRDRALVGKTLTFDEDPELLPEDRAFTDGAFAAANLYLATKDPSYLSDWEASGMAKRIPVLHHAINPSTVVPFLLNPGLPEPDVEAMKTMVVSNADKLLATQADHAYRTLWLGPQEGWFHTMAWGNIHSKARQVVAAHIATKDPRYKAAMESAADFFLGCNPTGTTMISGIGSVYPVVVQHVHSAHDGLVEPVPGIAPYTFTFGVNPLAFLILDSGHPSVKSFFEPVAIAFIPEKLGRKDIQANLNATDKSIPNWDREAMKPARTAIWNNFPIFRRKTTHPMSVVDQNEFTVNETVTPLALLFGALTAEGYTPSGALTRREPRNTPAEVPFYSMP